MVVNDLDHHVQEYMDLGKDIQSHYVQHRAHCFIEESLNKNLWNRKIYQII